MYTIRDVATLHGITPENARLWAKEFSRYLSPAATPSENQKRVFTAEDMAVFDLVARMKRERRRFEDIHASLQAGQRGVAPALDPADVSALALAEGERRLLLQVDRLNGLLATKTEEVARLKADLAKAGDAQQEAAQLQAKVDYLEADRQQLRADMQALSAKVEALAERAGREYAKGFVDGLKEAHKTDG